MTPPRVVLYAENFSDPELVAAVTLLAREVPAVHLHGMSPNRSERIRAMVGRRAFGRLRPAGDSLPGPLIVIPAPVEFAAGMIRRLRNREKDVDILRVYVPGAEPRTAITRWSGAMVARYGTHTALPDHHEDAPGGTDTGRHRVWVRGDEVGVYRNRPGGWLGTGLRLEVTSLWQRRIRAAAGSIVRSARQRAGR